VLRPQERRSCDQHSTAMDHGCLIHATYSSDVSTKPDGLEKPSKAFYF